MCFYSKSEEDTVNEEEKPSPKTMHQGRAIIVGSIGAALLVGGIVIYVLKMYAIAVVGGVVGLACISFVLYNTLKPSTKIEKVENVEQLDVKSLSSPTTTDLALQPLR